jgi:predicted deacylase
MTKVYSKALDQSIEVDRIIGHIRGELPWPTMIFLGGMHGNEPSGVFALYKVLHDLKARNTLIKGNIYAISGNLRALEKGERYHTRDLNRMWTSENMDLLASGKLKSDSEDTAELLELYNLIQGILEKEPGPFYFMDLHTTSSETIPFVLVNDSLVNRKFTEQYPLPMILGIEEYLEGPLLSYINELGYVAFGYEAGQHDDLASIENHIAFIYLTLKFAGSVNEEDINYYHYYEQLAKTSVDSKYVYEISYGFRIKQGDSFIMKPGFVNFQHVKKGQEMAIKNENPIIASYNGRIFMPRYQNVGEDGFFEIRRVPPFMLRLSAILRKIYLENLLVLLPGVRWESSKHDALIVNRNVARFFAKQFFHLLGYRSQRVNKNHLIMKNREAASREKEYYSTIWYARRNGRNIS